MNKLKLFFAVVVTSFGCSSLAFDLENYFPEDFTVWQDSRLGSRLTRFIQSKYSPDAMFETKDNKYFQLVQPSIDGAAYYTDIGSFISGVKLPKRTLATVLVPHRTGIRFDEPPRATPAEVAIAVNEALTNAGFGKVIFLTLGYGEVQELYSKGLPPREEIQRSKEFQQRVWGRNVDREMRENTIARMHSLQSWVFRAESIDPKRFSLVQTGMVMTSTSLPPPIHEALLSLFESNKLTDAWQRPYYLILSKPPPSVSERSIYELKIWSGGENELNEMGKGDDISMTFTNR